MQSALPRPEYPRPQFERQAWRNLNGSWTYCFDPGRSGVERELPSSKGFDKPITVPFCPESSLSGVGHTDFIEAMWYHRTVAIPDDWAGKRIVLHFGAVDYESEVYIDGHSVGMHWGGTSSFSHDITRWVTPSREHNLVVRVYDNPRSWQQPLGKQSRKCHSYGCIYTRTTGIWQTVWMEAVATAGLSDCAIVPDFDGERFVLAPRFHAIASGQRFRVSAMADGREVGRAETMAVDGIPVSVPLSEVRSWSPDDPFLYDLLLEVTDAGGQPVDRVTSYGGLRKVHVEGNRMLLNNEPFFQRLVLDQGFYPDGIWTAPSDEALKRDIQLARRAGFNGARLHQKVFEERFHYWADRLGYLTWGESSSWGFDTESAVGARNFLAEWREIVIRDRNHPSIVAWTPFNETCPREHKERHDRLVIDTYELTHSLDPTRPVNDTSGYHHQRTDLWTIHTYEQDPEKLRGLLRRAKNGDVFRNYPETESPYEGQPYIVDEFGGIKWIPPGRRPHAEDSWGYGDAPKTEEEFHRRLEGLVRAVVEQEHICGYCYTQLTDIEQEQNGVYAYDRSEKVPVERLREVFRMPSAHLRRSRD